jgi:hypothetical protein
MTIRRLLTRRAFRRTAMLTILVAAGLIAYLGRAGADPVRSWTEWRPTGWGCAKCHGAGCGLWGGTFNYYYLEEHLWRCHDIGYGPKCVDTGESRWVSDGGGCAYGCVNSCPW